MLIIVEITYYSSNHIVTLRIVKRKIFFLWSDKKIECKLTWKEDEKVILNYSLSSCILFLNLIRMTNKNQKRIITDIFMFTSDVGGILSRFLL